MTKTVELSESQRELLLEVLKSTLGDLSYEIADTDLSTYKDQLKKKRTELQKIVDQLA